MPIGGADVNDRANIKFSVYRIALTGSASGVANFTSAGRSITVYNGGAQYPANGSAADIDVMRVPLISVALRGGSKGIGNGNYLPGTIVNVTADIPPVGQAFVRWTGDTSQLANVSPLAPRSPCPLAPSQSRRLTIGQPATTRSAIFPGRAQRIGF